MAGLVPAIHVSLCGTKDMDGRLKAGHDESRISATWYDSAERCEDERQMNMSALCERVMIACAQTRRICSA
jgi:hypothetical protein